MVLSVVNNLRRHLRHDSYPCSACAVFVVNFDFLVLFMGMPADTYLCKRVNISVVLLPLAFRTRITSPFPLPMHRTISDSLVEFQPSGIIQDKSPFYLDGFFFFGDVFLGVIYNSVAHTNCNIEKMYFPRGKLSRANPAF